MDKPEFIVHQIWLGDEMPKEAKKLVEKAYKTCGKSGYEYKLWYLNDILEAFHDDYSYYFWKRIFSQIPIAPVMAAAVDYYKWKILSLTPEDKYAIYIDCDVEMMRKPRTEYSIPNTQAHISFGNSEQFDIPSVSYIQVAGHKAADIALRLADAKLMQFGMDSPHFLEDVARCFGNGKRNSRLSLGTEWVMNELLPEYEQNEVAAEVAQQDVYCHYGQAAKPLMLHQTMHLATEGKVSDDDIDAYFKEKLEQVRQAEAQFNKTKKRLVIYMSSARSYADNLDRTLGIISETDLRNVQRGTTFANLPDNVDYSFVVGDTINEGKVDNDASDIYYAKYPEGHDYQAQRFYHALCYSVRTDVFENIFFCDDDNYINLNRLLTFCNVKAPDDLVCSAGKKDNKIDSKGGILLTAALARKIVLADPDAPKDGEDFGAWLAHCIELVEGKFEPEYKFTSNKGQYPAPTNARITTHECNPYDLVALHRLNKG